MKKLVVNVSDELHMRLKVACTLQETDMSEVVRRLVADYVERAERRLKVKK